LEGACNTRELGGYATSNGRKTAWGRFLRSDSTARMTAKDKTLLKSWGLRTVIDLRDEWECKANPNGFLGDLRVKIRHNPISDPASGESFDWLNSGNTISDIYISMLEKSKDWLCGVLTAVATAPEGGVLFHCFAGKDRTGVIAACLLKLAGVSDDDVAADYMLTQVYLRGAMLQGERDGWEPMFTRLYGDTMLAVLDYFTKTYGGLDTYIQGLPLESGVWEAVRVRLL
jgi:protein-tyrosine phosphatase